MSSITCNYGIIGDPIDCDGIGYMDALYNDVVNTIINNQSTGQNETFNMTTINTSLKNQILPLVKKERAGIDIFKFDGIPSNNPDIDTDYPLITTIMTDYNAMKLAINKDSPDEMSLFSYYEEQINSFILYIPIQNIKKIRIQNIDRTNPICLNKINITLSGTTEPQTVMGISSYGEVTVIHPDPISYGIGSWVYSEGSSTSNQYIKTLSGYGQYIEFNIDPTLRINKIKLDSSFNGAGNELKLNGTNILAIDTSNTIVCDIPIVGAYNTYEYILRINKPSINQYVYDNKFRGDITKQVACSLYDVNTTTSGTNGGLIENGCYCKTGYVWNSSINKCMSCKLGTDMPNAINTSNGPNASNQPIGNGCYCATNYAWNFDDKSCVSCVNASGQIDASAKCASVALGTNNIQGILNNHPGKTVSDAYWELYNKLGTTNLDAIITNHTQTWERKAYGTGIPLTVSGAYWTLMRMLYAYRVFIEGIGLKRGNTGNIWVFTPNNFGTMSGSSFNLYDLIRNQINPFTFYPSASQAIPTAGPDIYSSGQ